MLYVFATPIIVLIFTLAIRIASMMENFLCIAPIQGLYFCPVHDRAKDSLARVAHTRPRKGGRGGDDPPALSVVNNGHTSGLSRDSSSAGVME